MKKLILLMGLPGSGKTTLANSIVTKEKNNVNHINMSVIINNDKRYKNIEDLDKKFMIILRDKIKEKCATNIIDALLIENNDIVKILQNIWFCPELVEIHYWHENKEACMWNDLNRHSTPLTKTIKKLKLEKLDLNYIKQNVGENFNIKVIYHVINKKSELSIFIDDYRLSVDENNFMRSKTYQCMEYINAINSKEYVLEYFKELDYLLKEVSNNTITQEQYQEIMDMCVSSELDSNGKYFLCDVENLYALLKKKYKLIGGK